MPPQLAREHHRVVDRGVAAQVGNLGRHPERAGLLRDRVVAAEEEDPVPTALEPLEQPHLVALGPAEDAGPVVEEERAQLATAASASRSRGVSSNADSRMPPRNR